MSPRTIQVITDISDASWNEMFAIMHGIAKKMTNEHVPFAPITPVKEFSISHAAFLTRLMAKSYLSPVVLFTNVAPHKTHTSDLIGKVKGKDVIFMGSNNGSLDWIVKDYELDYLAEITVKKPYVVCGEIVYLPGESPPDDYESKYDKETCHRTFGAHVIYGAIAVGLALGIDYRKFGEKRELDSVVSLPIEEGEVVHIDNYGNIKIMGTLNANPGSKVEISVNRKIVAQAEYTSSFTKAEFTLDRMMSSPTGSFVLYPSTSLPGLMDLALVRGNAAKQLEVGIGDILTYTAV